MSKSTGPGRGKPGSGAKAARRGERIAPLYRQVYAILREQIVTGQVGPDVPMPSEPALADRFAVSRITIRKTMEHLARDGLVRRVRGVGTFAVRQAAAPQRVNISGELDSLLSHEGSTTAVTIFWDTVAPSDAVRTALGEAPCLRVVRIRSFKETPIAFTTLHVPSPFADGLDRDECEGIPLIEAIERGGAAAHRSEQALTAVAAEDNVATWLGVMTGTPLILMRRLMLTADSTPILHQESFYAPDRFEYRMTLNRTSVGSSARWTPIA